MLPVLRKVWIVVLGLLIGGGFYLLLIDTNDSPELWVLGGVAILCALAFELSREQGFVEAQIRPQWLLRSARVLLQIPRDIVFVCAEAVAQLATPRATRGTFRAVAFDACSETPADTGRRALTEAVGSIAPNTIVVGVDADRGLLLVHQLRRQGAADQVDPLGLG